MYPHKCHYAHWWHRVTVVPLMILDMTLSTAVIQLAHLTILVLVVMVVSCVNGDHN